MKNKNTILNFIKSLYPDKDFIPLHAPVFIGNEKKYLDDCIESTFVSYVGKYVLRFEEMIKQFTGAKNAIAFVNGTSALHAALITAGVKNDDEVLTQTMTFIATVNAISYCNANPVFIDSERETLGMSPQKLEDFLTNNAYINNDGICINKLSKKAIKVCLPVHVFGHPLSIQQIIKICERFNITVVEDAAESLGSKYVGKHTGTFGKLGVLSFNGNKIVTAGGGGMIITNDDDLANYARHLSTTAKVKHNWELIHDQIGYNYRMTNVNAAIGCAQMENLEKFILNKRELASIYHDFFINNDIKFFTEKENSYSNYWLNVIFMQSHVEKDEFLNITNSNGIMTRPTWKLINTLPMYSKFQKTNLENAEWLTEHIVNLPSGVRL